MIVNGKLYTIFDKIEKKPLPDKEEIIVVEKDEKLIQEKKEIKAFLNDVIAFIDLKCPNSSNKSKQYLTRLCVKYYKK